MTRRQVMMALAGSAAALGKDSNPQVRLHRVPEAGIQPQAATDERGHIHLVYYSGDAHQGNLFYARSNNGGVTFSKPLSVNANSGSAIAAGTIRGAQMALGKGGTVHVAWNGSGAHSQMMYTRLNGNAFEPQRSLMTSTANLDGGGSIAADREGNVYAAWHAGVPEAQRSVYIAKSQDDGRTFAPEHKALDKPTGACGCCGMKVGATKQGFVALYRSATESVHRDIYLIDSTGGRLLHKWEINACPMSSMDIADNVGAWETAGQIYWAHLDSAKPVPAPGESKTRKHPRLAFNKNGDMLLVWTEGTGWQRGGSFAWQIYDRTGQPLDSPKQMAGIPTWSFAAPVANPDGTFSILY